MPLYIKGYKLDCEKIRTRFPREPEDADDDNYEMSYFDSIIDNIPRHQQKYEDILGGFRFCN